MLQNTYKGAPQADRGSSAGAGPPIFHQQQHGYQSSNHYTNQQSSIPMRGHAPHWQQAYGGQHGESAAGPFFQSSQSKFMLSTNQWGQQSAQQYQPLRPGQNSAIRDYQMKANKQDQYGFTPQATYQQQSSFQGAQYLHDQHQIQFKPSALPVGHAMFYPQAQSNQNASSSSSSSTDNSQSDIVFAKPNQQKGGSAQRKNYGTFKKKEDIQNYSQRHSTPTTTHDSTQQQQSKLGFSEGSKSFYPSSAKQMVNVDGMNWTPHKSRGGNLQYSWKPSQYTPLRQSDDNTTFVKGLGCHQPDIFKQMAPLRNFGVPAKVEPVAVILSTSKEAHKDATSISPTKPSGEGTPIVRRKYEMCKNWKEKGIKPLF